MMDHCPAAARRVVAFLAAALLVATACGPQPGAGARSDASPPEPRPLAGRVLSFWPTGEGTMIMLSRGREHGVTRGARGRFVTGGEFVVTEVYPYQCRARCELRPAELTGKRHVVFDLGR
jgi:hypothetical protein